MRNKDYKAKPTEENKSSNPKKKSYKGKGKKQESRQFNQAKVDNPGYDNDPGYYFVSPELAEQAAQLSFQNVLGLGKFEQFTVPSIAKISTVMCPGNTDAITPAISGRVISGYSSETVTSYPQNFVGKGKAGINLMASKLYTTMSQFTGRTSQYQPNDVAAMILAIASVAENAENIRRMFGIALTYNPRNRTLPLGILRTMLGNDQAVDTFIQNLGPYRMRFNVAMSRLNQIPLLDNIAFIKKSRDMYQKIYQDDPTDMSQLWYYYPTVVYTLDETGYSGGTVLSASTPGATVDAMLSKLEDQINQLLYSSTLNLVYADILNMSSKLATPLWQFDYLAENYVVMPEYNPLMNNQLHNGTVMGDPSTNGTGYNVYNVGNSTNPVHATNGYHIYTDASSGDVIYSPYFSVAANTGLGTETVVDMPISNPSTADKIESLRMTSLASGIIVDGSKVGGSSSNMYNIGLALPDHWISNVKIFGNTTSNDQDILANFGSSWHVDNDAQYIYHDQFTCLPMLFKFDGNKYISHSFNNLSYYTVVGYSYVKRLLENMTVGLFDFRVNRTRSAK